MIDAKSRLIEVEITTHNVDRLPVSNTEVMRVNTLISALAGSIQNVAAMISITPAIGHDRLINKIKDLAGAIEDLSVDEIDPFYVDFPYSAGRQKTYRIIREVK